MNSLMEILPFVSSTTSAQTCLNAFSKVSSLTISLTTLPFADLMSTIYISSIQNNYCDLIYRLFLWWKVAVLH